MTLEQTTGLTESAVDKETSLERKYLEKTEAVREMTREQARAVLKKEGYDWRKWQVPMSLRKKDKGDPINEAWKAYINSLFEKAK